MTNAKDPGNQTDLKLELFAAWQAEHPEGTRQQFDAELGALTSVARTDVAANHVPRSWDDDPAVIKRRMFEEWRVSRPNGTHLEFEAEWKAVVAR